MAIIKRNSSGRCTPTHNSSHLPEYGIWANMIYRCQTPTSHIYASYGGRGIVVCDRWMKFENFIEDLGNRPSTEYSLDRIDVNGDYCKHNCRWASPKEQARNRRNNVRYNYNNENLTVREFAEKFHVSYDAIKNHIRRGKDIDTTMNYLIKKRGVLCLL